jgi:hypothetical protein
MARRLQSIIFDQALPMPTVLDEWLFLNLEIATFRNTTPYGPGVMVRDWHRARARVLGGILVVILAR